MVLNIAPTYSSYLRLVSIPYNIQFKLPKNYRLELGKGVAVTEGSDAILFTYGPVMMTQATIAARLLKDYGIGLKVVNLPWLNQVDTAWLLDSVSQFSVVFTLDDHYVTGGQGDMLAVHLAETGHLESRRFCRIGITDIPGCGQNDEILKAHKLDGRSLAMRISAFVQTDTGLEVSPGCDC